MSTSKDSSTKVSLSILAAGLFIALAVMYTGGGLTASKQLTKAPVNQVNPNPAQAAEPTLAPGGGQVALEGEPSIGNKDTKVTLVEFVDYQCPFCKKFADETFGQIKTEYVDTGKIQLVFKDLPLDFHPQALPAAAAANCADDQGKYLEMHNKIFVGQQSWAGNAGADGIFAGYAKELGLDLGQFNGCIASGKYDAEIQADIAEAAQVGVRGTPSFLINGELLVGAQPFANFKQAIDKLLQ